MSRVTLLHFAQDSDTSGFFPQLARRHDRERYRMLFGTLKPMAPWLRDYMGEQGVPCFSCECGGKASYLGGLLRLAAFLRRERVQILHTHLFEPSVIGLLAGRLAGVPRRVLTRHYSDYHTRIHKRWHVRADQLCTRLAQRVIAVSEHTRDHMLREEAAPPGKVVTIHNGVDFDRVRVSSPDAAAALRRQYAPGGEFLLLQVGRLHPEKGYEHLFRAVAELHRQTPGRFRLLVAGEGPFRAEFERQVRELGLTNVVEFLGFRRDSPDLIAAADVLVLASVAEAFGLVLTEALYLGTPVVAARVGGVPEIVTHEGDGLLVPPADPPALAAALRRLSDDEALRGRLAGAGRARVVRDFSFERMMRAYEALYAQL
jgi:glycosyltransferase involved in cell wall biosynthesis